MSENKEKDVLKKKVDEDWKNSIDKEAEIEKVKEEGDHTYMAPPKADFGLFVSSLMLQAMIFLGEVDNPATKTKEEDLPHARYLIDTIQMIWEKTKGNVTKEEDKMLEEILYDLRTRYIAKMNKIAS